MPKPERPAQRYWSEKKVVGPDLKEGSQSSVLINKNIDDHYPFMWRVMKLDDHQSFLKKKMSSFENMGMYYFLNHHTSPQAALHFRAYIEHSKRIPTMSNKGESPSEYLVLAGIAFSKQQLLKACILSMYGDMTGVSIALVRPSCSVAQSGTPW